MEIPTIDEFLSYFGNVRERTMKVARCVPPEHLETVVRAGAFTVGDLLRHIAAVERYVFAESVAGRPTHYAGCGRELADGYEAVMEFMARLHSESMEIFAGLTPEDLRRKCLTPEGKPITTWKSLRAMVEHEIHHRGQLYTCLGLLGVPTPAIFGTTSERLAEIGTSATTAD